MQRKIPSKYSCSSDNCQQMSHAAKNIGSYKRRHFRHLALVGLVIVEKQYIYIYMYNNLSTQRPSLVGEVSANFMRIEGCRVVSAAYPLRPLSRFSRPEPLLFLPSSSSVVLTRLRGPRSRPTASLKMW
jgi:hypothetical protein